MVDDSSGGTRLGVGQETLRKWLRQAEVNAGVCPGAPESENVEIRRLKKEVVELRRTNDIPRTASAFFAAELERPSLDNPIRRHV